VSPFRTLLLFACLAIAAITLATATLPLVAEGGNGSEGSSARGAGDAEGDSDDDDDEHEDREEDGDEDEDEEGAAETRLQTEGPAARGAPKIRYVPGELLVRFGPGATRDDMEAAAARAGGRLGDAIPELGVHVIEVPPAGTQRALESLRSEAIVETVERDVLLEGLDTVPNDQLWSTQWGPRLVGAPRAWDATRGSSAVVIAVLDTGVDEQHPDLAGAIVMGRDFVNDDADPADDQGHGTGSAGVVAARTNNLEGQSGVCWACSVMPVKVLDSTGSGKTSAIAMGIVWAVDRGARVLNMSLGGPGTTSALQAAVRYASSKGAVLVASAGNSGVDTPFYPAAYSEVIGVAATTEADARYTWSNYGSWVQVAAPGCNTAPWLEDSYVEFCGTSAAAPIVSGIAGLALSLNPSASKGDVEQAITQTATPLPGVVRFGRVNAPTVMSAVSSTGSLAPLPPPPPPPQPLAAAPPAVPPASPPQPPSVTPPAPTAAPAAVRPPRLRGLARVGRTLRVVPGSWIPAPSRLLFRWQRCAQNGARCRTIVAAKRQTYRITRRDRRHRLRAVVIAVGVGGSTTARSGASSIVRLARRRR
jgi:subtilisin family serine protease